MPSAQSFVVPADQQRGIELSSIGSNETIYGSDALLQPWFCRIQRTQRYHIAALTTNTVVYANIENPLAAFGGAGGATPLYTDRDYRFGAFAGYRTYADPQNPVRGVFRIRAYATSALASGQTNVASAYETTFELPWPGDTNWSQFLQDGATKTTNFCGLTTTVQIVGQAEAGRSSEQWTAWDDPFVITHRASSTNYCFVIEYQGKAVVQSGGGNYAYPMVSSTAPPAMTDGFSPLYTLDFTVQPAWRSTFIHAPQFTGEPVPAWYYGKSLEELQGAWGFSPGTPPVAMKNAKGAAYLDTSPELRSNPALDALVASMGSDPIALANYVFNEIELADPVGYNENGLLSETSVSAGGLNRGAAATYLEGQGNPWEQCALLVYMLRKADVPAVYCEPAKDTLGMLDTQLSKILRMQIKGAQEPDGGTPIPSVVPVNYPWVAAWIASENRWVNLFPWIKDTEVIEGGNLYDQFPTGTKTGAEWVRKYITGDTNIVPDQVAVYQQEPNDANHTNGLLVVEAEGFHENISRAGRRWEPLAEQDESGTNSPSGYAGSSWMRPMPNTGTNMNLPGYSNSSPRLDYKVNFTRTGTHYLWVRGQGSTGEDDSVHVGLDGAEVPSAETIVFSNGTNFVWSRVNISNAVRTLSIPSATNHTINVWMREDGFRFDRLLLTTSSNYNPPGIGGGYGPPVSEQTAVEPNVPSNLLPRYARLNLGANTSFDDLGMKLGDRRYYRTQWDEFPRPFQLQSGSHQFYENLLGRTNTFDTVQVKLWSDRNGDGNYTSGVDGPLLDTGEWLSTDLHGRRFYTACRKTGTNAHQLRLYLAPYHSGITNTNTATFSPTNVLPAQLLTASLTTNDDKLQFEITHKRQQRAWKVGVISIDVTNQGSGYTNAPSVTIAAPPAGAYNRTAVATAVVGAGKVTGLNVFDPGSGYVTAPTVTLTGGGGTSAGARANLEDPTVRWIHPMGVQLSQLTTQKPQIRKGELAAICLNFGRVTDQMLRLQAEDFWQWERDLQTNSSLNSDPNFQEKMQSTSAYLMGMAYYNRVSTFKETDERLHKTRVLSMYAAGLSKLAPYRDSATANLSPTYGLPNSGDIIPRQATVDMFFLNAAYAFNGSFHPDSGLPFAEATDSFWRLLIAEISAQEHEIINDYYKESAAISTIKLLHRAKSLPAGIRRLTKANYEAEGDVEYQFGSGPATSQNKKKLKDWDVSMWSSIAGVFNGVDADYVEVFVTPGPVASASATYSGMGAMVFSANQYSALISGNMGMENGGSGSWFAKPVYSPAQLPNISLTSTSKGYSIGTKLAATSSNPTIAPANTSLWSVNTTAANLTSGAYTPSAYQTSALANNANLYGISGSTGAYYTATATRGSASSPSFYGGVVSGLSTLAGWASDPVSVVTGDFYIDATDLTLPGPFPLEIRRNYSSLALSDNEFGHGWKLAYFPYLVVGDNNLIYGAEMDGSVIAYRKDTQSTNLYLPLPADNPSLKNLHSGGAGASANVLNNRIAVSGTNYTLSGPNGQTRTFTVRDFPLDGLTRSRPYLSTWRDAQGNTLTFTFNTNSAQATYGLLKQITANNGNFLGFSFDVYGHIVEAWTGDGRRVKYTYDGQGDLRTVSRPDGSVHRYDYEQDTTTTGGESAQTSTHLLIRESKPGGRILENDYDPQRRVTVQRAVVGDTPAPVTNATFAYTSTQNTNDKTWTGTTTVRDAYNRPTVFSYTNSLITSEDDPETPAELRQWYDAASVPGSNGAYPRSIKQIQDRRGVVTLFKYDARGNLIEKSLGTDANPADLDGDGAAAAGEKSVTSWGYNTHNLPTAETNSLGQMTQWFYDNTNYTHLATRIEKWSQGQMISQTARTFTNNVATNFSAYGLLQSERMAAGSPDEAETTWTYDVHGYPTRQTKLTGTSDPAVVVDYVYNLRGELTQETDLSGGVWKYSYDAMGRRIWAERREGSNLLAWDYTYYNLNGEPEWSDGPRYNPEDFVWRKYDGNGRQTEEIRWRSEAKADASGVTAPMGDDLTSTTFNRYDRYNNLIEVRTSRRHSIAMTYDQIGRMTQKDFYDGYKNGGGTLKASELFQYEPGGQISQQTSVLGGVIDFYYNARGGLRKRSNADGSVDEWRYDSDGRVVKEILRNGSYWQTAYDDSARTVTRVLKTSGGSALKTEVKAYDRRGNCISETIDGQTFTKTYDDLNRLKTLTGPAATATSAQLVETHTYPDGAGREEQVTDGLNQKNTTLRDALGRVQSVEIRDAGNAMVRKTSHGFSADHNQTTVTNGTATGAIVTQSWTDTFGNTVLAKKADGTAETFFYDNGGLLRKHLDRALRPATYVRDWRGDVVTETRPGNVVTDYVRNGAGDILERTMPGGLSEQAQFDSAGRILSSKLVQGAATTRMVNYAYYLSNSPWAGLLKSTTDARSIVSTRTYDDVLRLSSITSAGPDQEDAVNRSLSYNQRDMVTSVAESGLNGSTEVTRTFDGQGAIMTETESVAGATQSALTQHFDAAGRRWKLTGAGPERTFAYRGGLMTGTTVDGQVYQSSYGDNGLLLAKTNSFRSVAVQTRDNVGRITDLRTAVGGVLALKEVVPQWWSADKIFGLHSTRVGTGAWNEYRDYQYDYSGRLAYEDFEPIPSFGEDKLYTSFDGSTNWPSPTGGLGVRTLTRRNSDDIAIHQVPAVGTYARVTSEQVGGSQPRSVPLTGTALGADKVGLNLDGRSITPVSFPGWGDTNGNWAANAMLAPGLHFLTATATHPSGWVATPASSFFQVLPRAETLTTTYDEMGNVATRTWSGGKAQTLTWDGFGRLVKVTQTGENPFTWTALYDGLDRRIKTIYTPSGGAAVTTQSVFDPEVEFLELGLAINGAWNWKVYGPDISGSYGGLEGLGGLEGVIGSDGTTRGIVNDWFGNTAGYVVAPGAAMTWSPAQFLAWGPAPGWGTPPLDGTKPLHELLGYRGLTVDPPGYIQQGLRAYDPQVGRWLSPDSMGHAASLSLYDYCDNDPLNVFDPDGRFGKGVGNGITGSVSSSSPSSAAFNIGMTLGGGISGAGSGAVGGAHIVNNSLSFGLSDSFGGTQSYNYQGSQYTASRVLADVGREGLVAAATLGVGNTLTTTTRAGVTTTAARGTGTVWDSVKATQPLYEETAIPRSFELATGSGKVWVHGNATEHMAEYATSMLNRGVSSSLVKMGTQAQMTSLQSAVNAATANGVQYGKLINVAGWELKFGSPQQAGHLPALIHAMPK